MALNDLRDPAIHALFVYNSNAAAVAPNQNAVLKGLRRADLFTVVHDQFVTDTAGLRRNPAPRPHLPRKLLIYKGAYGHLYTQLSSQAIAPLGEARSKHRSVWFARTGHVWRRLL